MKLWAGGAWCVQFLSAWPRAPDLRSCHSLGPIACLKNEASRKLGRQWKACMLRCRFRWECRLTRSWSPSAMCDNVRVMRRRKSPARFAVAGGHTKLLGLPTSPANLHALRSSSSSKFRQAPDFFFGIEGRGWDQNSEERLLYLLWLAAFFL